MQFAVYLALFAAPLSHFQVEARPPIAVDAGRFDRNIGAFDPPGRWEVEPAGFKSGDTRTGDKSRMDDPFPGPPTREKLQKYDPDQPRVPSGSGRQSGQWTSGGGDSAGDSQPSLDPKLAPGLQPEPEVNPRTILPTAVFSQACLIAQADCKTVAIDLAVENGEGDLPVKDLKDVKTCSAAGLSCQELSFAIAYVPFLDYGGVIFPHRGVIIMRKGRPDEYRRPLPGGRTPPFWRPPSL